MQKSEAMAFVSSWFWCDVLIRLNILCILRNRCKERVLPKTKIWQRAPEIMLLQARSGAEDHVAYKSSWTLYEHLLFLVDHNLDNE